MKYILKVSVTFLQGGYLPNKKKKRRKENDFSTLGEGYDETDPFIDNTDAVSVKTFFYHASFFVNDYIYKYMALCM